MSTAAIYCRISDDREGKALGVARQEEDCRELAERMRLDVVRVFIENDRGASTRSKKPRPEYAEMMRQAEAGAFRYVIAYSNSRLTRRPLELEGIIQLHERTGIQFATKVSGNDDLSTADGRMVARIKASVDAAEAERIGERTQRKHRELAEKGVPVGGRRTFGWMPDKVTLDPRESERARRAIADVLAGRPLKAIVDEWEQEGVQTVMGNRWRTQTLRQYLVNPTLAGLRTYGGKILLDKHGHEVTGTWEPLIDRATFDRLCLLMKRPEKRKRVPRRGARHYLLTGLLRCGVCNGPMYGSRFAEGKHNYFCAETLPVKHNVACSGRALDRLIGKLVLARLESEEFQAPEVAWHGEQDLADAKRQIEDLMGAFRRKELSANTVFPVVSELEQQVEDMQNDRTRWLAETTGPVVRQLSPEEWEQMTPNEQRPIVERLIDAVLVRPPRQRRANRLDPERVEVAWRAVGQGLPVPAR